MNNDLALAMEFLRGDGSPLMLTASPLQQALKAKILQLDPKQGHSVLEFEPGEEFMQGGGAIQGGIVATMLDFAMAFAAFARLVPDASLGSATLTINFMKPALPGLLIARGRVVRMGSRLIFAEAELGADTSNVTAAATTVMAVVPTKN